MAPTGDGEVDPNNGYRPYNQRRQSSPQESMLVEHRHTYQRASDMTAVDEIAACMRREASSDHKLERARKGYRIVLMARAFWIGLRQAGHHHRTGSCQEYQTIEMIQLLEDQSPVTGALDSPSGHWMISRFPSKNNSHKYDGIKNKQNHALHITMRHMRYPWAVVWDDVVAKIWQLRRRFLGRSGKVHVRDRSTEDSHKHVAYPPQYKGYGHFEVGQGQVIVLDVHGRLVGALLEFG